MKTLCKKTLLSNKMNLSLTLFIIGFILFIYGYMNQLNPSCNERVTTKVLPRHVYDEILKNSSIGRPYKDIDLSTDTITSRISY